MTNTKTIASVVRQALGAIPAELLLHMQDDHLLALHVRWKRLRRRNVMFGINGHSVFVPRALALLVVQGIVADRGLVEHRKTLDMARAERGPEFA